MQIEGPPARMLMAPFFLDALVLLLFAGHELVRQFLDSVAVDILSVAQTESTPHVHVGHVADSKSQSEHHKLVQIARITGERVDVAQTRNSSLVLLVRLVHALIAQNMTKPEVAMQSRGLLERKERT